MAPTRTGTAVETPMRQSCDRCHGRKLRCTRRAGGSSGACDTCLRKRAQCVYSFSLPKGRPSIYNIADKCAATTTTTTGANKNNNTARNTNTNSKAQNISNDDQNNMSNNIINNNNTNTNSTMTPAPTPTSSRSREVTVSLDSPQTTNMSLTGVVTPPESHMETTESYADLLAVTPGHSSGETHLQNEDRKSTFLTHGQSHNHAMEGGMGIMSGPQMEGTGWDGNPSSLHWGHPSTSSQLLEQSTSSSPSSYLATDAMDWASLGLESGSVDGSRRGSVQPFTQHMQTQGHSQTIGSQELERSNNNKNNSNSGAGGNGGMDKGSNSRGNGGDSGGNIVAQLSRLITRVSRLYRLSYDLASTLDPSYPMSSGSPSDVQDKMLIGETTFESVSAWLVHDSTRFINPPMPSQSRPPQSPKQETAGDALCHLFSASHNLLEALRQLQPNFITASSGQDSTVIGGMNTLPTPPAPMGGGNGGGGSLESSYFPLNTAPTASTTTTTTTAGAAGGGHTHNHYHHNSMPATPGGEDANSSEVIRHLVVTCYTMLLNVYVSVLNTLEHDVWATRHFNGATFSDIRLASIVQLCCSLTERQYRAVDGYLSASENPPTHQSATIWQELMKSGASRSDPAEEEEMRFLKTEVEQRLSRLQHMLHF